MTHAATAAPPGLVNATIKSALMQSAGKAAANIPATAAAMAQQEISAMFFAKLKTAALLLSAAIFIGGTGVVAYQLIAGAPANVIAGAPANAVLVAENEKEKEKPAAPRPVRLDRSGDTLPPAGVARLGTLHFRHGHAVTLIVSTADGTKIVYGGADPMDNHLRLAETVTGSEVTTGRELRTFALGAREVPVSAAISPDDKMLAASFRNLDEPPYPNTCGKVVLWDMATGKELNRLVIAEGEASDLAFHPNGKILALVAGKERSLHLWDCSTAKPLPQEFDAKGSVESAGLFTGRQAVGVHQHTGAAQVGLLVGDQPVARAAPIEPEAAPSARHSGRPCLPSRRQATGDDRF